MKVYLAHSFDRGADTRPLRESADPAVRRFVLALIECGALIIDPADALILARPHERFSYCLQQISESQALVVDARCRLGLGVGAEMMFAHQRGIPVLSVLPSHSYYSGWNSDGSRIIHAFVAGLSSSILLSFDDCFAELQILARGER